MAQGDSLTLAVILVALGVGLWLAVRWLLRHAPVHAAAPVLAAGMLEISQGERDPEAILVIQQGGKVAAASRGARQTFQIAENEAPDLEQLAKKLRPSEQFLNLCAVEGQAQLFLAGRVVEGSSFRLSAPGGPVMVVQLRFRQAAGEAEAEQDAHQRPRQRRDEHALQQDQH